MIVLIENAIDKSFKYGTIQGFAVWIKSQMNVTKKQRVKGESKPVSLASRATTPNQPAPVTLLSAESPEDTEQAWRTVRSYFGMEIFVEFDIGTPGQTLRILIDSGSDWFWVTTDECRTCGGYKRYDHKKSSTYKKVGNREVVLPYGSGDAWGDHI